MATENKELSVPEEQVNATGIEDTMSASTVPVTEESEKESPTAESAVKEPETTQEPSAVDFSDEEAELAANAPEFDLEESEVDENKETEESDTVDYSGNNNSQLLSIFSELIHTRPVQTIRKNVDAIKIAFYKNYRNEVDQLRKKFIEEGGTIEDFVPPTNDEEQRFKTLFAEYRQKRNEYLAQIETEKEENYRKKLQIIEELKELINSNETLNQTFTAFRDLQHRWKEIGLVPQSVVKDLWETYNLYVENFYNFIKINKELRDLDLKKNYEAKIQLCEEAEALVLEPSVINAFHRLQKLHEQWREIGPVANEYKDQLWDRFREASSKINKRHQEYFDTLKEEQKKNLDLKTELCVKAEELVAAPPVSRKEWNKASEQLIEIQKVWKTIGFAPKKDNTKIYERFRNACDRFFENKRNFYLQIKAEMENEICAQAESIQDSEEWKKTTDELIALQKRWKEIGPVARRHSDAVWKRFRAACDHFFERKAAHFSTIDTQYEENLKQKQALLEELKAFVEREDMANDGFETLKEMQRRWSEIGFVPIKQKDAIQSEYRKVVDAAFAKLRGNEKERHLERFKGKLQSLSSEGNNDRRIRHERDRLYNKMKQLEADIALLENNIGFFSKSKNAESMIRDVNEKIAKAKQEMETIIEKINLIDKQGE